MTAPVIAASGLACRLGEFALDDISLSLGAGEYWVLVGPSGSGKSVLLALLTGLLAPDRGRVVIGGRDATDDPPERRGIGLVFQHAALFPHYSVRGNLEYGLRARRLPASEIRLRVDEMIERLRLGPVLGRPVATLSGGEAQRVAIARALAIRPAALLLDEPLSLLDHEARLELSAELLRLHRELRPTTLHVTHSREEARALGDHVAVLHGGRLLQSGPMAEVLAHPGSPFVARFLGVPEAGAAP